MQKGNQAQRNHLVKTMTEIISSQDTKTSEKIKFWTETDEIIFNGSNPALSIIKLQEGKKKTLYALYKITI